MMRFDSWPYNFFHSELVVEAPLSNILGSITFPISICRECVCCVDCSDYYCLNKCCGFSTKFYIYDSKELKYTIKKDIKFTDCLLEVFGNGLCRRPPRYLVNLSF